MAVQDPETKIHMDNPESNDLLSPTRGCFCFPCFTGRTSSSAAPLIWWERTSSVHQGDHGWLNGGLSAFRKIREWSEIVAGPKWKTFIRRLNRNRTASSGSGNGKFQYDPLSYSLNFDEGPGYGGNLWEEEFSSRYAIVSGQPVQASPVSVESRSDVAVSAN